MSAGIALLDEALELARQERTALLEGFYEEAIDLAERRGELTGQAWNLLGSESAAQYRKRILELTRLQEQLSNLASSARDKIRESLSRSRQEKKRIRSYHTAIGQALQ